MKKTLFAILVLTILAAGIANALPLTIDEVEVEGVELQTGSTTRLSVERGQEITARIELTATQNMKDVEIMAFISGYEYNDLIDERLQDVTSLFDAQANVTYAKTLELMLPVDMDAEYYKLRIVVTDRDGSTEIQSYSFSIDAKRHAFSIVDVNVYPDFSVKAGQAILAKVRVENNGAKDENNVKVTAAIPALGIRTAGYIDEVEADRQEESDELYLRIPETAQPGQYEMTIEAEYSDGRRTVGTTKNVIVTKNELIDTGVVTNPENPVPTIEITNKLATVQKGSSAIYPIIIKNNARTAKSYTMTIAAPSEMEVKVTPSTTVVVQPMQSETIYLYLEPTAKARIGLQTATITIMSGAETIQQIQITADVQEGKLDLKTMLAAILAVLVVVLAVIGIAVALTSGKQKPQAYY